MWKICILYLHHHFLLLFNSVPSFCPVLFCSLLYLVTGHFPLPSGTRPSPTLCCPPPLCKGFFTSLVLPVHAVHLHLRPSSGGTKGCWRRGWLQSRGIARLQGKGTSLFVSSFHNVILKLKTNKQKTHTTNRICFSHHPPLQAVACHKPRLLSLHPPAFMHPAKLCTHMLGSNQYGEERKEARGEVRKWGHAGQGSLTTRRGCF